MKRVSIRIGLLTSGFFMLMKGASEPKVILEPDLGSMKEKIQQDITFSKEVKFFNYIDSRKEYLVAHYDEIVVKDFQNHTERQLFACEPHDLIKSVQYRSAYDDLVVATQKKLFLYSITKAAKTELYHVPHGHYMRSIKQLFDNRLLAMTNERIHYWNFKCGAERALITNGRSLTLVADDVHNERLLFTANQHLILYNLIDGFCKNIDMQRSIQSAIYKNGSLYVVVEDSVLHYDIASNACVRLVYLPQYTLRSVVSNYDGTKFLIRADGQVFLYDLVDHYEQTIFTTDNDHIWSVCFDAKDENQCIVRTSDGIERRNLLTDDVEVLFKKNEKEDSLFTVLHNNKGRDELLITTARRAIIVSLGNRETYELVTLVGDDIIKTARYNDSGSCVEIGSTKGRYTIHDLNALDMCNRFESERTQEADLAITIAHIEQEGVQIDECDTFLDEFDGEEDDASGQQPLQVKNRHLLITGCIALVSLYMSSFI